MSSTGTVRTQLKVIILDACVAFDSPYLCFMGWRWSDGDSDSGISSRLESTISPGHCSSMLRRSGVGTAIEHAKKG